MRKIAAQYVFPITGAPIKNGYVLTEDDGTVIETGKLDGECESTEFYNGIIIPGMVNSHCHIELSHLKGLFTQGSGMAGFIRQINSLRLTCGKEDRIAALREGMDHLYKQGVEAMADISNCDESFQAKAESPMYTRTFLEVFGTEEADAENIIADVRKLNAVADSYGIDAAPTPHACYTSHRKLIGMVSELGLQSGYLSYHSEESSEEQDMVRTGTGPLAEDYRQRKLSTPEITGKNSLFYFADILKERLGTPVEGNILLVHNTFTDSDSIDYALASFRHPFWAICPKSNLFINRALPPLELMRSKGLTITIGTDSLSSNTSLEMAEEIYTIQKHFPGIKLEEILRWATLNGAAFLGIDKTAGSFEKGKKPGVVLIDNIDFEKMSLTEKSRSRRLL